MSPGWRRFPSSGPRRCFRFRLCGRSGAFPTRWSRQRWQRCDCCADLRRAILPREMIGLVVAAHGRLAQELVDTGAQIVGPLPQVTACSVPPSSGADELREMLREAITRVDTGDGVLVLADLFGGSPCT